MHKIQCIVSGDLIFTIFIETAWQRLSETFLPALFLQVRAGYVLLISSSSSVSTPS
jgi:hypothetical protein